MLESNPRNSVITDYLSSKPAAVDLSIFTGYAVHFLALFLLMVVIIHIDGSYPVCLAFLGKLP